MDERELAVVVVGVTDVIEVEKTDKELRRRDDDGFPTKTKNTGVEAYYVLPMDAVSRLVGTNLLFSNVDPDDAQLLPVLSGMSPMIVHRSRGTNFGYRESNDFNGNCRLLMAVTGASRVFHFLASHNSGTCYSYRVDHDTRLCRNYGLWREERLNDGLAGNEHDVINPERRKPYSVYSEELKALKSSYRDNRKDFDRFVSMKTKLPYEFNPVRK